MKNLRNSEVLPEEANDGTDKNDDTYLQLGLDKNVSEHDGTRLFLFS